jgi:hypothetical protein
MNNTIQLIGATSGCSDLLCCPFCGSKAELINQDSDPLSAWVSESYPWAVECCNVNCSCAIPLYKTKGDVITDWNKRCST